MKSNKYKAWIIICLVVIGLSAAAAILIMIAFPGDFGIMDKDRLYDLGNKYLENGKYEEAIAKFEEIIKIDPKEEDAYKGIADAYLGLNDYAKASEALERGFAETGSDQIEEEYIKVSIIRAAELVKEKEIDEAVKMLAHVFEVTKSEEINEKIKQFKKLVDTVGDIPDDSNTDEINEEAVDHEDDEEDISFNYSKETDRKDYKNAQGQVIAYSCFDVVAMDDERLGEINKRLEKKHQDFLEDRSGFGETIEEGLRDFPNDISPEYPWYDQAELKSLYGYNDVISAAWENTYYAGGVGVLKVDSLNMHVPDGKDVRIDEALSMSESEAKKLIIEKSIAKLKSDGAYEEYKEMNADGGIDNYSISDFNYYIDDGHIYVYYNQYEILSGYHGTTIVKIK